MIISKHQVVIGYTQKLCSDGLESMIEASDNFAVRGIVAVKDLEEYLKSKNSYEVLIIELRYPSKGDLSFLVQLKKQHPLVRIMLISLMTGAGLSSKLIESGIDAYILKSCSKTDLFAALNNIVNGKNFFCSDIIKSILTANGNSNKIREVDLTQRETEVLSLLVAGNANIQIAKELRLSENTVKTHRKNILAKFGVNNLIGMIRFACRARLLDYSSDGFCEGCPHYN